jgi:hypothetical protein
VAAAASCLKDILGKQSIIMLMKCYEEQKIDHLFGYLEPFKPTKRKKVKHWEDIILSTSDNSFIHRPEYLRHLIA